MGYIKPSLYLKNNDLLEYINLHKSYIKLIILQITATSVQHVCTWSRVCAHTKQLTLGTSSCLFKLFGSTFEHNTVQKIEIATTPSCVIKQPESVYRWFLWQKNYGKNGLHGLLPSLTEGTCFMSVRSGNQGAGNLAQLVKVQICVEMFTLY